MLVAELTREGADAAALRDERSELTERQRELLAALARDGATVAAELGTPALRRLEARGLVRVASGHTRPPPGPA